MVSAALSLKLRPAGDDDVGWLVSLRNELASYFLSQDVATSVQTHRLLAASKTYIVEQTSEGPIASFAFYNADGVEVEFGRFMVVRGRHGQGLGHSVLTMALEEAWILGFRRVRLVVRADNDVARSLYLDVGFRQEVQLNGTIEMWRDLKCCQL